MSLTVFGEAHVFGITGGTVTNATVQSFSEDKSRQNLTNTLDELGNEIERRTDDDLTEVTIGLRFQAGYSKPAVSDILTYDGTDYQILTVGESQTNNAHVELTITAKTTEYISL